MHSAPFILVAPDADQLQHFAAAELERYLHLLFGVQATVLADAGGAPPGPRFLLGLADAPHIRRACPGLPPLSDQGHLLRRLNEHTLLLAGGSPAAAAWAVYELVEQYGVTYLLHGDVLPESPGPFGLPALDALHEPLLRLRSWRQFNDLPTGPALWSLAQQEAFIRQVFKLKFNGIYLCLWPHHPFVDFSVKGIRRQTATLLFGQRIPVGPDTIGRHHLPDGPHLDNPELVGADTYEEKLEAGRRLLAGILRQARFLRLHTAIHVQPLEFPLEFQPLLKEPATGIQLGGLTCCERGELTHPDHLALIEAGLRAHLEQWGEVDEMHLSLPEHPQADRQFRACWQDLDRRYGIEAELPLESLFERARRNYLIPGGLARAEREFRSAVSMLHFFDRLFDRTPLLAEARARGVSVHLNLGGNAEPLFPLLERVLWPGAGISTSMGYTASRAVRAMHAMESLDASRLPAALIVTLQDDNVGSLPQVATRSLELLVRQMQRLGWRGFLTRHWPVGDLDPTVTYLARAAWDASTTAQGAHHRHFARVYGSEAAASMDLVMSLLEDATLILDLDFLSLFFPVLGTMRGALAATSPMAEGLFHVRAMYEEAARLLGRVEAGAVAAAGRPEVAYWRSRLDFAIAALAAKEEAHEGGVRLHAAGQAPDASERHRLLSEARARYDRAAAAGETAVRAMASQVRDDSDRASLAAYHHFLVREVRQMADELLATGA